MNLLPTTIGDVSWNVTADAVAGANRWLLKRTVETDNGRVNFYFREGAATAGNLQLSSRLALTGGPHCGDGNRENCDCCAFDCTFDSPATLCGPSQGLCDTAESCSGSTATCPADGSTILDATLPPGAYAGRGTRGWKTNSKGTVWQYLDRTSTRIAGVSDVKATDRSNKAPGGTIKVTARGSKGTYPVAQGDEPVEATLLLGGQADAIASRCGETAFIEGSCKFNRSITTLNCKR